MTDRTRFAIPVSTALLLLMAGCSSAGAPTRAATQTITLDQAKQHVHDYVTQIIAIFPVKPRLVPNGGLTSAECQDPEDSGPKGRYDASLDYFLRDVPTANNPAMFAARLVKSRIQLSRVRYDRLGSHRCWLVLRSFGNEL